LVWACLAAAGIGLLAGMRFKAPVMLVLALMVVVGTVAVAMVFDWTPLRAIGVLALLLTVQQSAYLVGLLLSARR
jgi:hypothetical protein